MIASECGITTVGDFRVADIAVGGQGAPLVPYMDHTLLCRHYRQEPLPIIFPQCKYVWTVRCDLYVPLSSLGRQGGLECC